MYVTRVTRYTLKKVNIETGGRFVPQFLWVIAVLRIMPEKDYFLYLNPKKLQLY